MAAGEQRHDQALDQAVLPDDDLAHLEQRVFEQRGVVGAGAGIGHARTVRAAGRRRMGDAPVPSSRVHRGPPLGSPRHGDRDPARRARPRGHRRRRLRGPPVPRRNRPRAAPDGPRGPAERGPGGRGAGGRGAAGRRARGRGCRGAAGARGPAQLPRPPGQGPRHARRLPGLDPVPQGRRRDVGRAGGGPDQGRRGRRRHAGDPRRAAHDRQGRGDLRPRGAARPAQVPAQGPAGHRRPHPAPRARLAQRLAVRRGERRRQDHHDRQDRPPAARPRAAR